MIIADQGDNLWLGSEYSSVQLRISTRTGLPTGLRTLAADVVSVDAGVAITHGGLERRGPLGGLVYENAQQSRVITATGEVRSRVFRDGREYSVPVELGAWHGSVRYRIRAAAPSVTWGWLWYPGNRAGHLRDFTVSMTLRLARPDDCVVNVPGNMLRRDLRISELPDSTLISSIGGLAGSTGVIAVSDVAAATTLVVWPRSLDEIGTSTLSTIGSDLHLVHTTGLAAAASSETEIVQDGIAVDLIAEGWHEVADRVPGWFDALSVTTPPDSPRWTRKATIYEVQIGTSIFAGGWTYSPYPEMSDLYRDLPRIAGLGFDTIQIMPRQPFPSYNVVDYDDVDLSYGNEGDLRRVIDWCHANGMKVVLDVLLHGVIDRESVTEAADAVRSGPWVDLIGADMATVERHALTRTEQRELSWSRHILDFEKAWYESSAYRHPLCDERPEWFCTDSAGGVIGIYTKAFDMSNPEWQQYFSDAMVRLTQRLGLDGFRFDAPTYNRFPNWSRRTRTRASLQPLGSVQLFTHLRKRLHTLDSELMMYTEPNGALLRQSMDLNYNYDEAWLPDSLFSPSDRRYVGGVRSGRELAQWLADRDRTLPVGSVTAHHIDSHDTFWWPLPGAKWRHEQVGLDAARALMYAFALSGGPYMMFVGGEQGMEDDITLVNSLRADRRELVDGSHSFGEPLTDRAELFTVTHRLCGSWSTVLVNMSSQHQQANVRLSDGGGKRVVDLLRPGGEVLELPEGELLRFAPYQARMLVPISDADTPGT